MSYGYDDAPPPGEPPDQRPSGPAPRARTKGRLDLMRPAVRPKMFGRAMLAGPSGSGKTWTALRIATELAEGMPIAYLDTESESALTYADSFKFEHLPWRPPFDPEELTDTLLAVERDTLGCMVIDSATHFWRGIGGTLSIADGKFGGWKKARPVQEELVNAILRVPCHLLLCVRSKMAYAVETKPGGKQDVQRVGLEPQQDDNLMYEMNVAFDIDMDHNLSVVKSRTIAVPVGRQYAAHYETKAAHDYAEWLKGGVPPAAREAVDLIRADVASVADREARGALMTEFKLTWGMPDALTADNVGDAAAWTAARLAELRERGVPIADPAGPKEQIATGDPAGAAESPQDAPGAPEHGPGPDPAPGPEAAQDGPPGGRGATVDVTRPLDEQLAVDEAGRLLAIEAHVKGLDTVDLTTELQDADLALAGTAAARKQRLADHYRANGWDPRNAS